jgi:thiosulfate reductase cytochrome b subunit
MKIKKLIIILSALMISVVLYSKNSLHPVFPLKGKNGNLTNVIKNISTDKTCIPCHDVSFVKKHSTHFNKKGLSPQCTACHLKPDVTITKGNINEYLGVPENGNCASCHGLIGLCSKALIMPGDYSKSLNFYKNGKQYSMTQKKGVIFSPQDIADSGLNIKNKKNLNYQWDVHARRQLSCSHCHFTANDPRNCGTVQGDLDHLKRDPRKIKDPFKYLKWPDHRLNHAQCTCCHDPYVIHEKLPYKKRHMESLDCQSCHVPVTYGPAIRSIDASVLTLKGQPRIEFSNLMNNGQKKISSYYIVPESPDLLSYKIDPQKKNSKEKISPVKMTTRWFWKSAKTGKEVAGVVLKNVFFNGKRYKKEIIAAFDLDKNNILSKKELRIDSRKKADLIASMLVKERIKKPVLCGLVETNRIFHGIVGEKEAVKKCESCHSQKSKSSKDINLSSFVPFGAKWSIDKTKGVIIDGKLVNNKGLILTRASFFSKHYLFGRNRIPFLDLAGFILFLIAAGGVAIHGAARFIMKKKHEALHGKTEEVYMYGFYERIWHWTMAITVVMLMFTGFEIHYAGTFSILGLFNAVYLHNIIAGILAVNALLSLIYHIATGEIKQFFKFDRLFLKETVVQTLYYIHGIFRGTPHPIEKTIDRKLNPLQQITYVGLLNVLLPFQGITGIMIWATSFFPEFSNSFNGLIYIAPLHNLGSWLMITFLLVHLYLITTGHTVTSNIKAMVTGFDEVDADGEPAETQKLLNMSFKELVTSTYNRVMGKTEKQGEES